jgi:hypothetical protein
MRFSCMKCFRAVWFGSAYFEQLHGTAESFLTIVIYRRESYGGYSTVMVNSSP